LLKKILLGATLALILGLSVSRGTHTEAQVWTAQICVREWSAETEEDGLVWKPYEITKAIGWIDLRNGPQHGNLLDPGYMLITYERITAGADLRLCFGSDIDRILTSGERAITKSFLNHAAEVLPGTTLRTAVRDWFSILADPTGETTVKPLMPQSSGLYGPLLAPYGRLYTESFDMKTHYAAPQVLNVLQEDYKRLLDDVVNLRLDAVTLRKVVGAWKIKYKLDCAEFVPEGRLDIGCQPPTTTITESWTGCGDSTDLDCDLDWYSSPELEGDLGIASNRSATIGNSIGTTRAETNLSTDDHYIQGIGSTDAGSVRSEGRNNDSDILLGTRPNKLQRSRN
jgi:hypothetical protein